RPVWAVVDAARSIPELDEANNTLATGLDSHYQPPVADWLPRVEWQWDNAPGGANGVFHAPLVAPLIDTNGDGRVNERDSPANVNGGVGGITRLVALRGDTGQEIFSIFNPVHGFSDATPAVGDIDGDGKPEILFTGTFRTPLFAFNNDGTLKWQLNVPDTNSY